MLGTGIANPQRLRNFVPEIGLVGLLFLSLLYLWQARSVYQVAQAAAPLSIAPIEFFTRFNKAPANYQVVDTRSLELYEKGHIPVALSVPLEQFSDPGVTAGLDRWKTTVIVSEDGDESVFATVAPHFKHALNLQSGMRGWRLRGLVNVPGPPGATTTLA